MKLLLLTAAFLGLTYARPQQNFQLAPTVYITKYINDVQPDSNYYFSYEQSDGQRRDEQGEVRQFGPGPDDVVLAVQGSYNYVGDDGQTYEVKYTADENGFQPEGEHIPQSAGVKPKLGISSAALASLAG